VTMCVVDEGGGSEPEWVEEQSRLPKRVKEWEKRSRRK
jgi:hypothetical protein